MMCPSNTRTLRVCPPPRETMDSTHSHTHTHTPYAPTHSPLHRHTKNHFSLSSQYLRWPPHARTWREDIHTCTLAAAFPMPSTNIHLHAHRCPDDTPRQSSLHCSNSPLQTFTLVAAPTVPSTNSHLHVHRCIDDYTPPQTSLHCTNHTFTLVATPAMPVRVAATRRVRQRLNNEAKHDTAEHHVRRDRRDRHGCHDRGRCACPCRRRPEATSPVSGGGFIRTPSPPLPTAFSS